MSTLCLGEFWIFLCLGDFWSFLCLGDLWGDLAGCFVDGQKLGGESVG